MYEGAQNLILGVMWCCSSLLSQILLLISYVICPRISKKKTIGINVSNFFCVDLIKTEYLLLKLNETSAMTAMARQFVQQLRVLILVANLSKGKLGIVIC